MRSFSNLTLYSRWKISIPLTFSLVLIQIVIRLLLNRQDAFTSDVLIVDGLAVIIIGGMPLLISLYFYFVKNLTGIDLNTGKIKTSKKFSKPRIELLFEKGKEYSFLEYQKTTLDWLTSKFIPLTLILGAILILIILVLIEPLSIGVPVDPILGNPITEDPLIFIHTVTRYFLFLWFSLSFFSVVLTLPILVWRLYEIASDSRRENLAIIKKIPKEIPEHFDKETVTRGSIGLFRENSKQIAAFMTLVAVSGFGILTLLSLYVIIRTAMTNQLHIGVLVVIGGTIATIILAVTTFILPQYSLHKVMRDAKNNLLRDLHVQLNTKRFQYLSSPQSKNQTEILNQNQQQYNEITLLTDYINEIGGQSTWPFNLYHAITIITSSIISLIIPLILAMIEFIFSSN
ncbi:MAG: hypothetical protein ACXACK_18615 [Candidatus Hodarchaeales archaeon]|jgi:hypothetical protein